MIRPLRKYHFFIWRILAFLLPIIFVAAIVFRPNSISKYDFMENDFRFTTRKLTDTTAQLTVELTQALPVPSCLVYISTNSKDILLGKIDHRGLYHFEFPTKQNTTTVKLYDAIHKKEIKRAIVAYSKD